MLNSCSVPGSTKGGVPEHAGLTVCNCAFSGSLHSQHVPKILHGTSTRVFQSLEKVSSPHPQFAACCEQVWLVDGRVLPMDTSGPFYTAGPGFIRSLLNVPLPVASKEDVVAYVIQQGLPAGRTHLPLSSVQLSITSAGPVPKRAGLMCSWDWWPHCLPVLHRLWQTALPLSAQRTSCHARLPDPLHISMLHSSQAHALPAGSSLAGLQLCLLPAEYAQYMATRLVPLEVGSQSGYVWNFSVHGVVEMLQSYLQAGGCLPQAV